MGATHTSVIAIVLLTYAVAGSAPDANFQLLSDGTTSANGTPKSVPIDVTADADASAAIAAISLTIIASNVGAARLEHAIEFQ